MSNRRVGIGPLRAERQPAGELRHRGHGRYHRGARVVSQRYAVVVDQPRLHDCVAHAGVVAPGQHVVVAQQVLALARVLDQRAQSAAAAIHNLVAARVVVRVVAARAAQQHRRRQRSLMRGRVARNPSRIQQHHGCGPGNGTRPSARQSPAHCGHHIGSARSLHRARRRVGDCAGGKSLAFALATHRPQRTLAAALPVCRACQLKVDARRSACLGQKACNGDRSACAEGRVLRRQRLQESRRDGQNGTRPEAGIRRLCCGHHYLCVVGGQITGRRVLAVCVDASRPAHCIPAGDRPGDFRRAAVRLDGRKLVNRAALSAGCIAAGAVGVDGTRAWRNRKARIRGICRAHPAATGHHQQRRSQKHREIPEIQPHGQSLYLHSIDL